MRARSESRGLSNDPRFGRSAKAQNMRTVTAEGTAKLARDLARPNPA